MRLFAFSVIALFCFVGSCPTAIADQADTTVSSEIDPMIVSGEFQGCDIVFSVLHSDGANFGGAMVLVTGDMHIGKPEGGAAAVMLKIGVGRITVGPDGKSSEIYEGPTSVVLVNGLSTNKPDLFNTMPALTPGFRLLFYKFGSDTSSALINATATGRLSLTYELGDGLLGSNVDLDMAVMSADADAPEHSKRIPEAGRQLGECISKIMQ